MNATVKLVREKLDKVKTILRVYHLHTIIMRIVKSLLLEKYQIQSGADNSNAAAASKKPRVDNRRRI